MDEVGELMNIFSNLLNISYGFGMTPRGSDNPTFPDDTTGIDDNRIEDSLGEFGRRFKKITVLIGIITTYLDNSRCFYV